MTASIEVLGTLNCLLSAGRATFTTVESIMDINIADTKTMQTLTLGSMRRRYIRCSPYHPRLSVFLRSSQNTQDCGQLASSHCGIILFYVTIALAEIIPCVLILS